MKQSVRRNLQPSASEPAARELQIARGTVAECTFMVKRENCGTRASRNWAYRGLRRHSIPSVTAAETGSAFVDGERSLAIDLRSLPVVARPLRG
jgi:hypothetical protein